VRRKMWCVTNPPIRRDSQTHKKEVMTIDRGHSCSRAEKRSKKAQFGRVPKGGGTGGQNGREGLT